MSTFLTIFSAPKPFNTPHIATIQSNAIRSWTQLPDTCVLLLGDEVGLAEAASDLGAVHIRELPRSPSGAPRMDAMFRLAREHSPSQMYCIVNADIILFPDLLEAARQICASYDRFVLLGQRWDMDIPNLLDFNANQGDWAPPLQATLRSQGHRHRPTGSDYFLFPAACYQDLPAFTIGRAGWDNWMVYQARKNGFPAIDGSAAVTIIHQNHDYAHLPGGQPHYKHPETKENIRLAGGRAVTRFTVLDTDYRLVNGQVLRQKLDSARLWRRIESWPLLAFGSTRLSNALWRVYKLFRRG